MRTFYSLVLLLLLGTAAFAQTTVTGKVTDSKGDGLPGVSVALKGTSSGVISDADGTYSISAPADGKLIFSFIGFKTTEIAIGGRTTLDVVLDEDVTALDEVVVIGYGVQKKSVATASISKVSDKQLLGFPNANVGNMLQGQVSGVTFKQSSGQPGSGINILIRGPGTNGNTNPLIIVDGVAANDGVLSSLNPSDIESVQILKDAASSAIYGARGANGVILVTTKRAKTGEVSFNYNFYHGVSKPWKMPEVLNAREYVRLTREKYANGSSTLPAGFPDENSIATDSDWFGKIIEPAATQTHQLSISKGTENSSVLASFSYFKQDGVVAPHKSNMQRFSTRINTEQTINKVFTFGQNLYYSRGTNESIGDNNSFGSPISEALVYDPITPFYDENGTYGFAQSPFVQKEYLNPLSQIFITNNSGSQDNVLGNAFLKFNILKGLTFRSDAGIDYNIYSGKSFTPSYTFFDTQGNQLNLTNELNDISEYSNKVFIWQWENFASYNRSFGKHSGEITLGSTLREQTGNGFGGSSSGIPEEVQFDPNFQVISNTPDSLKRSYGYKNERYAMVSFFGRFIYNYDEKYLATFILRRDATTRFGSEKRYGLFPSVALGWVISREAFWNVKPIDFFKFRASYGINGSDRLPDLQFTPLIGLTGQYPFGKPGFQTIYNGQSALYLPNAALQWEQSQQVDIGFEFGLLNSALNVEIDYYVKKTAKLLMARTVGDFAGAPGGQGNVGEMVNRGLEVEIKYGTNFGPVSFNADLNFTTLRNRATKVSEEGFLNGYTWPVRNTVITRMEEGYPVGYFRGYKTAGIFNSDDEVFAHINSDGDPLQPNAQAGDIKYVDVNKDGVIDVNDMTYIGKPWASLIVGLNLRAAYRGFEVRALFTSSFGNDIFRSYERQDVINNNYTREWLDRWTESNTDASYPRLTTNDTNNNSRASDFYVEDASFVRLKNLQIAYTIPASISEKALIRNFRVYLAFDNLLTFTRYTGFDPEIGTSGWILDTGIDKGFYPLMKTAGAGVSITF